MRGVRIARSRRSRRVGRLGLALAVVLPLAAVGGAAWAAYVCSTCACPWPTPYPPAGAAWGTLYNPSLEIATNNVPNNWTAWKDPQLPGSVHYTATDRVIDGARSHLIIMPQPPAGTEYLEAGIYQRAYVVPGGTYTISVRIYMEFSPETYSGEDLLSWLGVDPYGQDSGDGPGMVWANDAATKNMWHTRTVTVQAIMPVMTVSLKATRKWPQHGNGAKAWFDNVTISGPIPIDPPPGPEADPIDPETLIPATVGSNLVPNASFEDTYTNGASAGWNRWSTFGSGKWERSLRLGKVGGGRYDCGGEQALADMNPKTILLYGGTPPTNNPSDPGGFGTYGTLTFLNQFPHLDDMIVVGRPAIDGNMGTYQTNPVYYGRQLADQLKLVEQVYPRIDCWQGLNEPGWNDENWQWVISFEKAFAERAHELGMKTVAINLSTGSPGNIWQMINENFNPSCHDLLDVADYLGHHVYGGPTDEFMVTNQVHDDACSFALRPRRFKDMYDRRGWRFPPVIATEGSTWGAWRGRFSPDQVGADLVAMGEYMNANDWWCGYTNFVVGAACSWLGFDIVGQGTIVPDVGTWNANHPADAKDGLYSQTFGSGYVHPKTTAQLSPDGDFNGGVNRQITGLVPGRSYVFVCWMKYAFRGVQPSLSFYLGVDPTGQTANGNAATIDWGDDQVADKARVHETFTHVWRTFTATSSTTSIWLRAHQVVLNPSFRVYVDKVEVREIEGGAVVPFIGLDPPTLTAEAEERQSPPDQTFTIRNAGIGTLSYSITTDAEWLSVEPQSGTATTEVDTITVHFGTQALSPGVHNASIIVSATDAANTPQSIGVSVTIHPRLFAKADFDQDNDVDVADFGFFQLCFNGPGRPYTFGSCPICDFDADNDVDLADFSRFLTCYNGPNRPVDVFCAD